MAKLIGDIATGQVIDAVDDGKDPKAVSRRKLGGQLGGAARAEKLPAQRRTEIAKAAATARWKKKK